ncbi:MAG TPA: Ig-like domain-containing protein [Planctomycetota bacterium]
MLRSRLSLLAVALLLPACGGGGGGGGGAPPPPAFLVTQRVPGDLATGVVRTFKLYIRVNRAANPATVNVANVVLSQGVVPIGRAVAFDGLNNLVVITPSAPLGMTTTYTVSLGAGLQDTNGVGLTPDTFTFTTSGNADVTLPDFSAGNFALDARTTTSITVDWQAATDGVDYQIFIIPGTGIFDPTSAPAATVAGLAHTFPGLNSDTRFEYRIRARDAAGNLSPEFHPLLTKTLTSFTQDFYNEIVTVRCQLCHVPGGAELPPFFMDTRDNAYLRLAGADNDVFCATSPVPKRVIAGDLANSFLNLKINPAPPCGDRMPRDGMTNPLGYLNAGQIQTVQDWILEGALDN